MFRGHGTDCRRELWHFAHEELPFYDALLKANRLRYEWFPYIYSLAGGCWLRDDSMIKLLSFIYPEDREVWNIVDQYLFGDGVMVCPVLHPMYFDSDSRPVSGVTRTRRVYLPRGNGWYDYWTNTYYEGGQWIEADAPMERIPLFIREGSVLPCTQFAQSTEELPSELDIRIYAGKDCEFTLYEDEGDGYSYEQGEFRATVLCWNETDRTFTVHEDSDGKAMAGAYRFRRYILIDGDGKEEYLI